MILVNNEFTSFTQAISDVLGSTSSYLSLDGTEINVIKGNRRMVFSGDEEFRRLLGAYVIVQRLTKSLPLASDLRDLREQHHQLKQAVEEVGASSEGLPSLLKLRSRYDRNSQVALYYAARWLFSDEKPTEVPLFVSSNNTQQCYDVVLLAIIARLDDEYDSFTTALDAYGHAYELM